MDLVQDTNVTSYPPRYAFEDEQVPASPHWVEQEVQRELLSHPQLRFASLVVRRLDNGVCLQGVLETNDNSPDVSTLAQRVAGVERVLNHLVRTSR